MSLASRLPYDHPYAGGYPGIGSQPLPTDADALDYLSRMATADGAGVETGVAVALDAFITALKADSLWDAIGSSCLLCGPRTLAGALVPLRGDAPTAYGFVDGDYSRTDGITGDGTSYLDSGRDVLSDDKDNCHFSVWQTTLHNDGANYGAPIGMNDFSATGSLSHVVSRSSDLSLVLRLRDAASAVFGVTATGFYGASRSTVGEKTIRYGGSSSAVALASVEPSSLNMYVFAQNIAGTGAANFSNGTAAFYSIGSSVDLAKLDSHISSYVTAIGAAI